MSMEHQEPPRHTRRPSEDPRFAKYKVIVPRPSTPQEEPPQTARATPQPVRQPGQTVKGRQSLADHAPRAPARSTRRGWLTAAAAGGALVATTLAARNLSLPIAPTTESRTRPTRTPLSPTYTPEPTPPPAPPRRPDESRGEFFGKHFENFKDERGGTYPQVIDAETNTPLPPEQLGRVFGPGFEILGYGPRLGTFLVASFPSPFDKNRKQYIVSQKDAFVNTIDVGPLKEVKLKEGIGINLNEKDSLQLGLELGISRVRINLDEGKPEDLAKFQKDIEEAKKLGIKLNILFQPHQPEDLKVLQDRLDSIFALLGDYQNVSFELGNEPDAGDYWKDNNLETFAEFVKTASDYIQNKRGRNAPIIIAALIRRDREPFERLLGHLQAKNVRLADFYFGLHAYGESTDITMRLSYMIPALERRGIRAAAGRIVATEIGVQEEDKSSLFSMLSLLRERGIRETYIFSLVDPSFSTPDRGFGFVFRSPNPPGAPNYYGKLRQFYLLQQFIQTLPGTPNEQTYDTLNKTIK